MNSATAASPATAGSRLGSAWATLCAAFALHILDEALTGFLNVYNPTVIALRRELPWLPISTFGFQEFLLVMICAIVIVFALSPAFFKQSRWAVPLGYFFAVINILNAMGHFLGTILGQTVPSVTFSRPAPGFYSSPFLLAACIWLIAELRKARISGHSSF
jgi:hypothetical protein